MTKTTNIMDKKLPFLYQIKIFKNRNKKKVIENINSIEKLK